MKWYRWLSLVAVCACTGRPAVDAGTLQPDAGITRDAGTVDAGRASDASVLQDTGAVDTGVDPNAECFSAEECDDGIFCNGAETCTGGECVSGEPPCEQVGCLSGCHEIEARCLEAPVPRDDLCEPIDCALASCNERGLCDYVSETTFQCNRGDIQDCNGPFECKEGLACVGEDLFVDNQTRCMEPCGGTDDCTLAITRCWTEPVNGEPFNHCIYNFCGEARYDNGDMLGVCSGQGENSGSCYPVNGANGFVGVCFEGGQRQLGQTCAGGAYPWPTRPDTGTRCVGGLWCHEGVCRQLCSVRNLAGRPRCGAGEHCADAQPQGQLNDVGVCMPGGRCLVMQGRCPGGTTCVPDSTSSLVGGCLPGVEEPIALGAACELPGPEDPNPCTDGAGCWLDFRDREAGAQCLKYCDLQAGEDCPGGTQCRPLDARRGAQNEERLGFCYP